MFYQDAEPGKIMQTMCDNLISEHYRERLEEFLTEQEGTHEKRVSRLAEGWTHETVVTKT